MNKAGVGGRFLLLRNVLLFVMAMACAGRLVAQVGSVQVLHSFSGPPNGTNPEAPVIQGSDGNFYGTTAGGAGYGAGTVYKLTPAGVLTTIYSFTGGADGANPACALTQGSDGNFYGTTEYGGSDTGINGNGTIFKITPAGVLTTVYTFTGGADGSEASAALTKGSDNNFYGTTYEGGANGDGTVFEITPAGVLTTLYTFTGGADGAFPQAALIQGSDGNFYGTTTEDSVTDHLRYGTIFKVTPAGVLTTLYSFTGGAGGSNPAGLTQGSDGNFYGTTEGGGDSDGDGTVFKITPAGVLTTLYTFTGGADGAFPQAGLTQGSDGNFYGTTSDDGIAAGTVFKITPAGVFTALYTFTGVADGAVPDASLTLGVDGNFYGTTRYTGVNGTDANGESEYTGYGTVFKITPAGVFTTLYTFTDASDGASPYTGLTQDNDGNFYGTTSDGGDSNGDGTIFEITPAGVFTLIYTFTGGADGASPNDLTLGSDGNFYGTTEGGGGVNSNGFSNEGTVFKITPAGVLTTLYTFTGGADGGHPYAQLTLGADGNFYGTTGSGNSFGDGTIFKITPAGVLTTLYTFTGGADGAFPQAALIQGSNGNFYGTTPYSAGGDGVSAKPGTVFKITPAGVLTTIYTFTGGTDGSEATGALTQGIDGNFYGTTDSGGDSDGDGTVFKITPTGVLTTLYSFTGGADGDDPHAKLTLGADGNFYGATDDGANDGVGTVFKITPAGVLTTLYTFSGADGADPAGRLTQASDGSFYGTASGGGQYNLGVVFHLTLSAVAAPVVTSATESATVGSAFSYQIVASNSPTSFGATGLPAGLSVNGATGVISGTPTQSGTASVTLTATNAGGTGSGTLSLTVSPEPVQAPVVTGGSATAQVGSAFSFQIVATNSPTNFGASGLPAGLSVDPVAGLISGTPTQSGTFTVGLTAANSGGAGSGTLSLTVSPAPVPPPAVTSALTASAQVGSAFSYQIVATNSPTSFAASGLPAGLSVDPVAGLISGTPTQSGTFTVTLTAANSGGAGTGALSLTVTPAPAPQPTITLTSPPTDETVVSGSTVSVAATVNDPGSILSQVQFTLNGAAVGPALTAAPYAATVTAPAPGTYVLQAIATDNLGRQSTNSHTLTVIPAATDPAAPSADLLTDLNGRNVGAGATIIVTCNAASADGSPIQQVNFYANGTLFASLDGNGNPIPLSTTLPGSGALRRDGAAASTNTLFQAAFQIPISGGSANNQYTLLAIALSKLGTAQTSGTVTVTAIPQSQDTPPPIALSGLSNKQHLTTGKTYTASTIPGQSVARAPVVVADAPAGSLSAVAKIEYYLNKLELLNTSVTGGAVPNLTFTAPAPGQYILEAIATDTANVASVADPITVEVDALPVVSVSRLGGGKAVVGGKKGKIVISRTGDTSSALKVTYKVAGSAVKGVDYDLSPAAAKVTIPAGSASVVIKLKALADPAATGSLVAKFELRAPASGAYTLGSESKAKITILQH